MHFDDRLATVMRLPATSRAIARIQFRQLIDLLGEGTGAPSSAIPDEVALKLGELGALIPVSERATILREPTVKLRNPALVAWLAAAEPDIASAAIGAAQLGEDDWIALIPSLPVRARGILRHRQGYGARVEAVLERLGIGDRGLPPVPDAPSSPAERPQRPELVVLEGGGAGTGRRKAREEPSVAGIGAIVRRIEAFRTARSQPGESEHTEATPAALGESAARRISHAAIDFSTDSQGRIDAADGPLAPGLVGGLLSAMGDERLRVAVRQQQPLRDISLVLTGALDLAGAWRLDALPRFGDSDGRFLGYAGRLRRRAEYLQPQPEDQTSAPDSMREVLHELRTPANAIQVAAEIIQQQLYGPAPHEYRALAAAIAADTAQILAGFEELDRLVRLESGALSPSVGACDLGSLLVETVARLRSWTGPRGSDFHLPQTSIAAPVALDPQEAAGLVWRLLATLAGLSSAGEAIALHLDLQDGQAVLAIDLPSPLAERLDQAVRSGQSLELARSLSAGIFGVAFTLRLAAAEAAAAGGKLVREGACFTLVLPGLTPAAPGHTQARQ